MNMEHLQDTAWADYVRGVIPETETAAMAAHLAGCRRCERTTRALGEMVRLGIADTRQAPPEYVVHAARAIFALSRPDWVRVRPRLLGALVFDSFRSPVLAGVRSGQPTTRQMLYEAGPYSIDLRLDHERGSRRVWLTGQIATAEPSHRIDRIVVALTAGDRVAAEAYTNSAGEFQLEYEAQQQPLQLRIDVRPDEQIQLPLAPHEEARGPDGGRS